MRWWHVLMVLVLAAGCAVGGTTERAGTPAPTATPSALTTQEWIVFTDNGIRELRTRFAEFASGRTAKSVIEDDIAYLDREIKRINAITPDPCWAEMHSAYFAVVKNSKAILVAAIAGDMATAQARYDETGRLNDAFSDAQEAVAKNCR